MSVEELVKRLRSPYPNERLANEAADKLEELAAEIDRVRDGNRYAQLERIAVKRAEAAETALAEAKRENEAMREKAHNWSMEADKYKRALDRYLARNAGGNDDND